MRNMCFWERLVSIVVVLSVAGCYTPLNHYRKYHDMESLHEIFHKEIRNGNSLWHMKNLLGGGLDVPDKAYKFFERRIAASPEDSYPDGFEKTDKIYLYPAVIDGIWTGIYLQFRNDVLINHNPKEYENYEPVLGKIVAW